MTVRRTRSTRAAIFAALLGGVASAACGGAEAGSSPSDGDAVEGDRTQAFARVVNVEVTEVRARAFVRAVRLTGVVQAMRDVLVSAEEAGVVRRIVLDKGRTVRQGQAILRLDDTVLSAQVRTASAQAELARELWERRKRLFEEDEIGSEISYLEAKSSAEQTEANLAALRARLDRTVVTAPVGGVLDERLVEVGARVSPGTPVARIVQVDTVKVQAGVPERFALEVTVGAAATVAFDVLEGETFQGEIAYVGATVDPDSRTFAVELLLENPGGRIKPEMIAEITVVREEIADAIVVPQDALVSMEEGYVAFVVEGVGDEALALARPVEVLAGQGDEALVASGLEAGARLVVVGQQGLTAGDRVRVVAGRDAGSTR